jgi:hypothetical protein
MGDQEDTGVGEAFEQLVQDKRGEKMVPGLEQWGEHDRLGDPESRLELNTLKIGDELTLEFYPSSKEPEPEPIIIDIQEVGKTSIKGLARGGLEKWEDLEILVIGSTVHPHSTMMRVGVIEPGLCPELHFTDEALKEEQTAKLKEIYIADRAVRIHGNLFDDAYFDEYRTDLDLPTTEERVNWLASVHNLGHRVSRPGELADYKVESPQKVDLASLKKKAGDKKQGKQD